MRRRLFLYLVSAILAAQTTGEIARPPVTGTVKPRRVAQVTRPRKGAARPVALASTQTPAASNLALEEKIALAAENSTVARRSAWGAHAVNLSTGEVIYGHHADSHYVPASNTKLFSTAFALTRLGPNHRYSTALVADGVLDASGTLAGNLRLVGGGDPMLSGRPYPYTKNGKNGDPMRPLEGLVEDAYQAGLRAVSGDVIGDDSAYVWEPYPPGWSQDDTMYEYGAPVSALVLHDNTVSVDVRPGEKVGDRALIDVRPSGSYFFIESHVTTGPEQRVQVERGSGPRLLTVWGSVRPNSGFTIPVPVPDPAHYAAHCLREALERRGIRVQGGTKARHRYFWHGDEPQEPLQPGLTLASRQSPPLIELLKIVNKVSQNLHAELALREVARVSGAFGSRRSAMTDMSAFLRRAGIGAGDVNLIDGSGLSRLTLATPAAFTSLLKLMHASPNRQQWLETLPIGGEDGTLSGRFRGLESGRIMAKTGTLSHVNALSGYIENGRGEMIAFSVMVNNAHAPSGTARTFIDTVVKLLTE
jgi:D-alanyl-D-alanine carboxypeptidase/D-alanyl-D-alanine-endopeptidase (penicillin-binding protein 4)